MHVAALAQALAGDPALKASSTWRTSPARRSRTSSPWPRGWSARPEPQALAGKVLALLFFNPSLRTLASFQSGMARLGGSSFVISPGQGTWLLETREGVVMDGAAAEHVREAIPVLASYADALGIRSFAGGTDLAADLADTTFHAMAAVCPRAADQPGVGGQPPLPGAGRLEDDGRPAACRRGAGSSSSPGPGTRSRCRWPCRPRPSTWRRCGGWTSPCCGPRGSACRAPVMAQARSGAPELSGGSVRETADRREALEGAHVIYAKSWTSPLHYGNPEAEAAFRAGLRDWCVGDDWFATAAPDCRFMHCLPVRRNVVVKDSRARRAAQRGGPRGAQPHVGADGGAPPPASWIKRETSDERRRPADRRGDGPEARGAVHPDLQGEDLRPQGRGRRPGARGHDPRPDRAGRGAPPGGHPRRARPRRRHPVERPRAARWAPSPASSRGGG